MKKKDSRRALSKFSKVSTHKRKSTKKYTDRILAEIAATGVGYDGVKITEAEDGGRRGRKSSRTGRDEVRCEGIYSGSRSGFGFVDVGDENERDIFIPEGRSGGAIDGDYVEVIYHEYTAYTGERKTEGRVVGVLKPGREVFVGILEEERVSRRYGRVPRRLVFIADDPKVSVVPIVKDHGGAAVGERVAVRIKRSTGGGYQPECNVVATLGAPESLEANYGAVLIESGIPVEFKEEELLEARRVASLPIDLNEREDRRDDIIFTIDGAGAKDLDDAVSLRKTRTGWLLGVHIADVSHYVEERTALDRAAMQRGTSVYFVDKVVPMLPPELSNGACSLNAGEDKCTLSAFISLDKEGRIVNTRLANTVIRSRVRGVYSEVNEVLGGTASDEIKKKYREVTPALRKMVELYNILLCRAEERGMLELDLPEAIISLGADGEPIDIRPAERGVSERIIEQFMLCANEAVARLLREEGIPAVYRVHASPKEEKIADFLTYASNLGLDIRGISPDSVSPRELSHLLLSAKDGGVFAPVSYTMLRSMAKAEYSHLPEGHFGLGLADYCHFTSPIRRLSDLATHRIIKKVLIGGKPSAPYASYAKRAAVSATEAEIRAVGAERRIENLYKAIYMNGKIGEEFDGVVSSVASFGMFVMLPDTCEGLVPIDDMPGGSFYDERCASVRSSSSVYRVGDGVRVRLEEVDLIRCKLKFSIIL